MAATLYEDLPPASGLATSDGLYITQGDNTVKQTTVGEVLALATAGDETGGGYPLAASFPTAVDGDAAGITATDTDHGLILNFKQGAGAVKIRGFFKTRPSGTSWYFVGHFKSTPVGTAYQGPGIAMRNSSSGKIMTWGPVWGPNTFQFNQWPDPNDYGGTPFNFGDMGVHQEASYYKVECDGTNLIASISSDGDTWYKCGSTTLAAFIDTIDQIGFAMNCQIPGGAGLECGMAVLDYWDSDTGRLAAPGGGGGGGGIGEAPSNGNTYARKNAGWVPALDEAPETGVPFVRKDGEWVELSGSDSSEEMRWIDHRPGYQGTRHSKKLEYDSIGAGAHKTLIDIDGKGYVSTISLAMTGEVSGYRRMRLRVWIDSETNPRVDCRLENFFAAAGGVSFQEDYLAASSVDSIGYRVSFPMPFDTHLKIELYNDVGTPVNPMWSTVDYNLDDTISWGRFKRFNCVEVESPTLAAYDTATLIDISDKRGQLCGIYQYWSAPTHNYHYLEGNHQFYIDGSVTPDVESSGTEDYYCNWFYFGQGVRTSKFYGCTLKYGGTDAGAYRIHGLDPVPFDTGLKITWKNGDVTQAVVDFTVNHHSVVWYYTDD